MSAALTLVSDGSTLPTALGPDLAAAIDLAKAEKAASTRKAYGTDFRLFREWCEARGVLSLPAAPETVAAYLAAQASILKASTLADALRRSGTRTSWLASPCQPMRRASRRPCAAFAEATAAPGSAKPRRWPARCLAWSPRHRTR